MKAEEMFEKYNQMKFDLSVVEMQLKNYTGISERDMIESMVLSGAPEGERVQTSNLSDKTAMVGINFRERLEKENKDYCEFLYKRYAGLKKEIEFFEECVRSLDQQKADIVFELLDGDLTWDEIASQYMIGRTTIHRIRKEAFQKINRMYDQREEQEMMYLLS